MYDRKIFVERKFCEEIVFICALYSPSYKRRIRRGKKAGKINGNRMIKIFLSTLKKLGSLGVEIEILRFQNVLLTVWNFCWEITRSLSSFISSSFHLQLTETRLIMMEFFFSFIKFYSTFDSNLIFPLQKFNKLEDGDMM